VGLAMTVVARWTGREDRFLRLALRLSVREFAEDLGINPRTITRWESLGEGRTPSPELQRALDTTLARADDATHQRFTTATEAATEVVAVGRPVAADAQSSTSLTRDLIVANIGEISLTLQDDSSSASCRIPAEFADDVRAVLVIYRRAYRTALASQLYASVHQHMKFALSLAPGHQDAQVRRQLLTVAGEMAATSAVILGLDLGRWSDAALYLDLAHRVARDIADVELESVVLACRAFHAAYGHGDKLLGADLAEAAFTASEAGACSTTRGWVAAVASERHADLGNAAESRSRLDKARSELASEVVEESWSGIGSFDSSKIAAYEGGNLRRLGDFDGSVQVLDAALAELGPAVSRHRTTALIDRAEAQLCGGHLDAACVDTSSALAMAARTQHAHTVHRAESIAKSALASGSSEAQQLWKDVLFVKTTAVGPA
jgi:transcriptional regulator with XRE-family HTH domain